MWCRRLFSRLFGWRYVLLTDGDVFIRRAQPTEAGWICGGRYSGWIMLLPGGETHLGGAKMRWYPCLGWEKEPGPTLDARLEVAPAP